MKSRKIKIMIIIIMILLIIIAGAVVFLYFATDIFKTDKQLFFKYLSQIGAEENNYIDENIGKYYEKKKQNLYKFSGKIKPTVDINDEMKKKIGEEAIDKANEITINYSGKSNGMSRKFEQNIEIDYGNDVIFPINYKQYEDIYGLQTKYIGSKYIAVENNNLKEFAEKLGVNSTSIPDKIEATTRNKIEFTQEEKDYIKENYGNIISEKLTKEMFTRNQSLEGSSYILTISIKDIQNIIIDLLEKLKQDKILIDKLNEYLEMIGNEQKIDEEKIQESIDELQDYKEEQESEEEQYLKIIVTQNNKKLSKIEVQSEETDLLLSKTEENNSVSYKFDIKSQYKTSALEDTETNEDVTNELNIFFNIKYTGLQDMKQVNEEYQMGIAMGEEETLKMNFLYDINSQVEFVDMVQISELDENNTVILNDYEKSTIENLFSKIGNRLIEVNKEQMKQLGIEEGQSNPILYTNILTMSLAIIGI